MSTAALTLLGKFHSAAKEGVAGIEREREREREMLKGCRAEWRMFFPELIDDNAVREIYGFGDGAEKDDGRKPAENWTVIIHSLNVWISVCRHSGQYTE